MYTEFYNLKEKPFNLTPSSRFVYLGEVHKEALALLTYGLLEKKGYVLLTGEVGTGKTTVLRTFLEGLDDSTRYVYISNPLLSQIDFINYLAFSVFGNKDHCRSKAEFLMEFEAFLDQCLQQKKIFLLVIDEAHKLSFELLEEIRLLSNMETGEEKLINIFLVGQPELNERLSAPICLPLLQRINIRYHISPLDLEGTRNYVATRLRAAGTGDGNGIFSEEALDTIYHCSGGYPRMINILSDNALLLGYSKGDKRITPQMIRECHEDMMLTGSRFRARGRVTERTGLKDGEGVAPGNCWDSLF